MTIVNPHLEGETRTGTLPLTSEVLSSDIALTNISEMLFNIMALFLLLLLSSLKGGHFSYALRVNSIFFRLLAYQNLCRANVGVSQSFI